jgi:hypothetical protein
MEIILKFLNNIKENQKKLYVSIAVLLILLFYLAVVISFLTDIDPFIYFKF